MKKRLLALLCVIFLLAAMVVPAAAAETVDMTRKGSLSITMTYRGKAVPGGKLTIYRVAEIVCDEYWNYSFRYLPAYEDCEIPVEDLDNSKLAKTLAAIVKKDKLTGIRKTINNKGKVTFTDLELGLYLVVQTTAAPGYSKIEPFVVTVPGQEDGAYVYDVDATPKMDLEPEPTEPRPTRPSGKLPQTGQLNWPVPVLLSLGLLCFLGGWCLRSGKKKDYES